MVVEPGGGLRAFNRDELFISIYESCKHRKSAPRDATALTLVVIGDLLKLIDQGSIQQANIVQAVHKVLKRFDQAAATYYAAYHPLPATV
jgi:transcriptional regulator NrdR family protein